MENIISRLYCVENVRETACFQIAKYLFSVQIFSKFHVNCYSRNCMKLNNAITVTVLKH